MKLTMRLDELSNKQLQSLVVELNKIRPYEVGDKEVIIESIKVLFDRFYRICEGILHLTLPYKGADLSVIAEILKVVKEIEQHIEEKLQQQIQQQTSSSSQKGVIQSLSNIQESKRNILAMYYKVQNNLVEEVQCDTQELKDYKVHSKIKVKLSPEAKAQLEFIERVVLRNTPEVKRREKAITITLGINVYHDLILNKERTCDIYIPVSETSVAQLKKIEDVLEEWWEKEPVRTEERKQLEKGIKGIRSYIRVK